jgi:hypothetical protein
MNRKLFARGDIWLIAGLLLVAAVIFFILSLSTEEPVYARISVRGYPDIILDLSVDTEYALPQNPQVLFRVNKGAAAFVASDCPDKICVNSGYLNKPWQSAACMPNMVSLTIIGSAGTNEPDI